MAQRNFATAINDALHQAMAIDSSVICYGLGVTDPKAVFGTTANLEKRFGSERVFDMPTSENAMTGIAIGAALNGIKTVMTHQRIDFFLLAMDQLVNGAAKWYYMFGGQTPIPITIRLIIGRGWGQGPTHSQNLQAWFSHIPGLKVIMPTTAEDAKGLLLASIFDPNPVLFLEHRWLHNSVGEVPEGDARVPLGKARIARKGTDVTIVAMSYMTVEALHAADYVEKQGVSCEVIDLRTIRPIDRATIIESVKKTSRCVTVEEGFPFASIGSEIASIIMEEAFDYLDAPVKKLASVDGPLPYAANLERLALPKTADIIAAVKEVCFRG